MNSDTQVIESGPAAGLPRKAFVQHAADAPTIAPWPTSATRFMFSGIDGHPDFYEYKASRGDSPPLHRHPWATLELVLEGEIRYLVDGEEITATAGDFVYTPPSAAHSFFVESDSARSIGFNHPNPRFAELQEGTVPMFAQPGGPDMSKVAAFAGELGVELLGPPMQPAPDVRLAFAPADYTQHWSPPRSSPPSKKLAPRIKAQ